MKTCYYYQTFIGLNDILTNQINTDVIIVSSLHFDTVNKEIDIFLNNNKPTDKLFDNMWNETKEAHEKGITIMMMLGGAGGAYQQFFLDIDKTYPKLVNLLKSKPWIHGIDLDIEEEVDINNVKILINKLFNDFGEKFIITMAPVCLSLISDEPGMGGFSYKELYNSPEGKKIHWFNTQSYGGSFKKTTVDQIVKNKYPVDKIVLGMMSGDFDSKSFPTAINEIKNILTQYPNFGGVYDWEYLDAPPDKGNPQNWARCFKEIQLHNMNESIDNNYGSCNIF